MIERDPIATARRFVKRNDQETTTNLSVDAALFARFLGGDDVAFLEFFDRHTARIGSYCRKMLGQRYNVDDLLQDLWEQVLRLRDGDRPPPHNPLGLLYWMARNLCLNSVRTKRRSSPLDTVSEEQHPRSEPRDISQIEELTLIALEKLPLEQRETLILQIYSGYSVEEIARMMDTSEGAVRTRAWRGRRELKRVIVGLIALDDYQGES